jgi:hypothetical protein
MQRREKEPKPEDLKALPLADNAHELLVEYSGGYWAPPWPNDKRNARGVPAAYVRAKAINACIKSGYLLPVKYGMVKLTDAGKIKLEQMKEG